MVFKMILAMALTAGPHWLSSAMACDKHHTVADGQVKKCQVAYVVKTDKSMPCKEPCKKPCNKPCPHFNDGRSEAKLTGHPAVVDTTGGSGVVITAGDANGAHVKGAGYAVWVDSDGEMTELDGNKFVFAAGDGEEHEGHVRMMRFKGDGDEDHEMIVELIGDGADGNVIKFGSGINRDRDAGWLGVSIKGVSDEMADQLNIEGTGVQILNVVKASPAEDAGLKANDVIIAIDGDGVSDEVAKVVELVSRHAPGDEVDVTVLRDGRERTIAVILGTRADIEGEFEWKFDVAPFAEIEENVQIHGKMLHRNDDGDWVFEDLGDLHEFKDLHKHLNIHVPGGLGHTTQVWVDGNEKSVKLEIKTDEGELSISQENDGEITVTRTEDGEESVEVYATEDDLAEADPEAFEHYNSAGKPVVLKLDLEGIKGLGEFEFEFDADELQNQMFDWKEDLHEQLEEAHESYGEALELAREAYQEALEAWRAEHGDEDGGPAMLVPQMMGRKGGFIARQVRPRHTFSVDEGGAIEVRIRAGDSELLRRFESEDDLADRNPRLYEKYERLMEVDEDAE
ncbi:MAG: S1C family serine protease [Planctomycetota bacterium]|jgi:hypothetical protein